MGGDGAVSGKRWLALALLSPFALGLLAIAVLSSSPVEKRIRQLLERRMNERIDGYSVALERVELHPLALGFDVHDLVIARDDHPEPPVAQIIGLSATVEWRSLLHGTLVADVRFERPIVYVDRRQAEREVRDETPVHERGWQDALQAMVPLEINGLRVVDGEVTYVDDDDRFEPLRIHDIQGEAANIRNVVSEDRTYPSELSLDAQVFDEGRLRVRGRADFLAKPQAGVRAKVELEDVAIETFQPLLERRHFDVRGGVLALSGSFEFGRSVQEVNLRELVITDLRGDYVRREATGAGEPSAVERTAHAAETVEDAPLRLEVGRITLSNANVGVQSAGEPGPYRLFLSDLEVDLRDYSNQPQGGAGRARMKGLFMGSGEADATLHFGPDDSGPDLDLALEIVDTDLRTLNDVLRAHGRIDVTDGLFSFYSKIQVEDGRVRGYVKPLLRELDVHDPAQDRGDSLLQKVYEGVAGGIGELLENRTRDEVATETDLSGVVVDPDTNPWQLIWNLLENAFLRSIRPGFDHAAGWDAEEG
jgi:hypothetical protein